MRKTFVSILAGLALIVPTETIIAAPKSPKLAKCDGKQRRLANPYGSILPTVDPVNGTSTPASETGRKGVDVFPEKAPTSLNPAKPEARPTTQVPPISSEIPSTPYRSC